MHAERALLLCLLCLIAPSSQKRRTTPFIFFFFPSEDGLRAYLLSRGLGDVYTSQTFLIVLDGQTKILPCGAKITIRKSVNSLCLLHLDSHSFTDTLRKKLLWAAPVRE